MIEIKISIEMINGEPVVCVDYPSQIDEAFLSIDYDKILKVGSSLRESIRDIPETFHNSLCSEIVKRHK